MNYYVTFDQCVSSLEANHQSFGVLALQNEMRCIITCRGGRILGPFLPDGTPSLGWINPAFADPLSFSAFLQSGHWNLGGERIWIAPEIQYIIQDRRDFWGTHRLPHAIDPGNYTLDQSSNQSWHLSQQVTLQAYNLARGEQTLSVDRVIQSAENPLRFLSTYQQVMQNVSFAGYLQTVSLTEGKHNAIMTECWNLTQLNAGGQLIIPVSPRLEASPYFGTVSDDANTVRDNHLRINITGTQQYKVGYKAAHVTGRMAYLNRLDEKRSYLLIRHFNNNPSTIYAEEPPSMPGVKGHSIHVYNDGGQFGGFGEMECNGQTIGATTGISQAIDTFYLWVYVGQTDQLNEIIQHLLGVTL